ncbi:MAG: molybdenum cofactor biosynthesis protein MoaE, partial [Planctomycetota bacterium]
NHHEGKAVEKLFYEGYEEMAYKKLQEIRQKALRNFEIKDLAIVHRLGEVPILEASLLVVVASPHRLPALRAVEFVIDEIKKDVPIWKKEYFSDEAPQWVEPENKS